ncbi:MAG: M23 family metallopeptidase [Bacteroidota bacterium]
MTPHQAYAVSLEEAGLQQTALGRAWFDASQIAVDKSVEIATPYREVGYLDPKEVAARGYHIRVLQGQMLEIEVSVQSEDSMYLFLDLFELPDDSSATPRHVATSDSLYKIQVEPKRDITYLIRLQPELLRGGRYTFDVKIDASLGFPVAGHSSMHIHSFWGAPRDGGRRLHKGVDVFALTGTPVVAISDGYVARIDETVVGGKVIWVRDASRNQAYYYAHLDEFLIEEFTRVKKGDTLGTVGRTGNAYNTPPHLHFGIYAARSAVDPLPFIKDLTDHLPPVAADTSRLGEWARVTSRFARLRKGPSRTSEMVDKLPRHTAIRVLGGTENWYSVELPNGKSGFILSSLTEDADDPIRNMQLASGRSIRYSPSISAVAIDSIGANSELPVFGEFGGFIGVTSPNGRTGWISAMD